MTVKELKSQLDFYNDDLEVAVTVECVCGMTHYMEPSLELDELGEGDESQKFLVIEPSM